VADFGRKQEPRRARVEFFQLHGMAARRDPVVGRQRCGDIGRQEDIILHKQRMIRAAVQKRLPRARMADGAGAVAKAQLAQGAMRGDDLCNLGLGHGLGIAGGLADEAHPAIRQMRPDPRQPVGAAVKVDDMDGDGCGHNLRFPMPGPSVQGCVACQRGRARLWAGAMRLAPERPRRCGPLT